MFNVFQNFEKRSRPISSWMPYLFDNTGKDLTPNVITTDAALLNSDIFSIIFRISSDMAAVPLLSDEPLQSVINKPQNFFNVYNFRQQIWSQLMLTGNAYCYIKKNNDLPIGLELIPFSQVQLEINDDSSDINYYVDWSFSDEQRGRKKYSSADILHFKLLSTAVNSVYIGTSPLVSLAREVEIQNQSNRLTLSSLKNAISPTITLNVPEGIIEADAKKNIRDQFIAANSGQNSGKPIVLDQGLQLHRIDINPDVAKLLANTTFSQTQIAKAFCVPDDYLNGKGNEQSSIEQVRSLYQNSLNIYMQPILAEMQLKFNTKITADIATAMDVDNQQLIDNVAKLSSSKTPVLTQQQANLILEKRGVFN